MLKWKALSRALCAPSKINGLHTYAIDLGTQLVGMVVMICCHTRVPTPRKMHHTHCSMFSGVVEKATPPTCTMKIWGGKVRTY